jgi:hypothetical protein
LAFVFWWLAGLASGAAPAKWFLDMETGNPGDYLTTTHLNPPATHGGSRNWITESGSSDPTMYSMRIHDGHEYPLLSPVAIDGINFSDRGSTRTILSRNDRHNHYAKYRVPPLEAEVPSGQPWGQPKVSVGCYLRLEGFKGYTYGSYDLIELDGGGQFAVVNLDDGTGRDGHIYFRVHTQNGTGERIEVASEKTYWITLLSDRTAGNHGVAELRVYDPATWQLVGAPSVLEHAEYPSRQNIWSVWFGRCDAHGGGSINATTAQYFDDLIVDESGREWPLMPGGTPQDLRIISSTRVGTNLTVEWTGGTPPYQVQTRDSFSRGDWTNFGPVITGNSVSIPMNRTGFVRVVGR